jgi:alpha-N-acetylgalactosaminidase
MGWLSWERFGCNTNCVDFPDNCISETLYMTMADLIVEFGLKDVGYRYVNIDDCWSLKERRDDGTVIADPERFSSGMKALSEYIHSKGLLFGMYTDIGTKTCGGYPGLAPNHTDSDIGRLVEWEIDALKVDGCYTEVKNMSYLYSQLSDRLNRTGRPILYSCSWPAYQEDHCENPADMDLLKSKCNLWRNWDDIEDSWRSVKSVMDFFARKDTADVMVQAAGPGHWNDPDMLIVGNPGTSIGEQRAQFAIWAILAAPLYISTDLRTISSEALAILKNSEIIAVNQDPLGQQGYVLLDEGQRRIWVRELSESENGEERVAVVFENKATIFGYTRFCFSVQSSLGWTANGGMYSVRDLHLHDDVRVNVPLTDVFTVDVDESSIEMYVFTKHSSINDDQDIAIEYI